MSANHVPLLDLRAQYAEIRAEVREAIDRVLESQHFIMGPEVAGLEREVAEYCQCDYGIGVSSGTDALTVALMAIGVQPGDEVVTTPYTFFATAGCIARLGARPVFVDIDPATYNLDVARLEEAITERTKAIVPVHLFGQMVDMDPVMALADRYDLHVIEDAAQAIGAEYNGQRAGSIGHLGCLSFFPSKNLGGYGDGGMVVSNDPELARRVDVLRKHGAETKYYHEVVGGNFRLDALQAAVLRVKLRYLDEWTEQRRRNASRYRLLFSEAGLNAIRAPQEVSSCRHIYNQFVIRVANRDELIAHFKANHIGCEVYYPRPMHLQECFAYLGYAAGDFVQSELAAQQTLAIPIYPELSHAAQQTVVSRLAHFYRTEQQFAGVAR